MRGPSSLPPLDRILSLEAQLRAGCATSDRLDDESLQAEARTLVPVDTLRERADARPGAHALLRELLAWFKHSFFTWVDAPKCVACGGATKGIGQAPPTADERSGGARRVELYACKSCGARTRFPRFNDPRRLMCTRAGRCGEWANTFTLFCRALGFRARYVVDVTDHVWTECWSESEGRWLHADPCENRLDAPLLYSRGWKKKLSYVFAFGPGEAVDVVNRYVDEAALADVQSRRTMCSETYVSARLEALDKTRRSELPAAEAVTCAARRAKETAELASPAQAGNGPGDLGGRTTGSADWRRARGELGEGPAAGHAPDSAPSPAGKVWQVAPAGPTHAWRLRYSALLDAYGVGDGPKPTEAIVGWAAGAFHGTNILRKEEHDWNMVYLARGSSGDARMEWRFASSPGSRIVGGHAALGHALFADAASVRWRLSRDRGATWRRIAAPKEGTVSLARALAAVDARGVVSKDNPEDGCEELRLAVELSGDGWQATQLFRQSMAALDAYGLDITLLVDVAHAKAGNTSEAHRARARIAELHAQILTEEGFQGDPTAAAAEAVRRLRLERGSE